jgi:hypothetical protein
MFSNDSIILLKSKQIDYYCSNEKIKNNYPQFIKNSKKSFFNKFIIILNKNFFSRITTQAKEIKKIFL